MMAYLLFLFSLSLTVLIEGTGMYWYSKNRTFVYYSLLCNLLTNPLLNLILLLAMHRWGLAGHTVRLLFFEICVVFAEGWLLYKLCGYNPGRALLVSIILNGLSYAGGWLAYDYIMRVNFYPGFPV